MKKFAIPLILLATSLCFAACSDDDDDKDPSVRDIDKWIGSPCTCEGEHCKIGEIQLPAPQGNAQIIGCENIDLTGIEGGVLACLPTISQQLATTAPPTYFPQGYCTISAVGCEGSSVCNLASYGDVEKLNKCPTGSVMITSVFDYPIMDQPSVITNKTCAKTCNTDADCNTAGAMSCIKKGGYRFCYNLSNFEFMGDKVTFTKF